MKKICKNCKHRIDFTGKEFQEIMKIIQEKFGDCELEKNPVKNNCDSYLKIK